MKSTAKANANIALVKYWGKRDSKLILPYNSSISITLEGLSTVSTVEFSKRYKKDTVIINGKELKDDEKNISGQLERIRKMAGIKEKARVVSETNFPVAAGLASSASGLAALSLAASSAAGLKLSRRQLSMLARQGSGSASRSIYGGFVQWRKGSKKDGSDSYAEQIADEGYWPDFRVAVAVLSKKKKKVGSRAGMSQTVKTCPFYDCWLKSIDADLKGIRRGILDKDISRVGSLAEYNCLKLHALMMTTRPAIIYWLPETIEIIRQVLIWREEGIEAYFTIDAGPQVKIICLKKDLPKIRKRLGGLAGIKEIIIAKPGQGTALINKNLF